jgi:hypothetical protein
MRAATCSFAPHLRTGEVTGWGKAAKFRLALVKNAGPRPDTSRVKHRMVEVIADSSVGLDS